MNGKSVEVYAHWQPIFEPTRMGVLTCEETRGHEVFSFAYDEIFLTSKHRVALDPSLNLYRGIQYNDDTSQNFRAFLDSSPDRWGRVLMQRRAAVLHRMGNRETARLSELDYLLGVHDHCRMGGLRFRTNTDSAWLDNNTELAAPPFTSLAKLEYAALHLEDDPDADSAQYLQWLNMLIAPGSSLGGARPKANIIDTDNELWIAKFPNKNDTIDVGGWERVCHMLAKQAKIEMAPAYVEKLNTTHHTFITKRFDREGDTRIHFASAMTLLGYYDGKHQGASYLELAEFIVINGAFPEKDLEQLWRRIVFYIAVSNTDDHLRNHGFLLTSNGWKLSPAYDINPESDSYGLSLNISEHSNALDYELAFSVAEYFRIDKATANKIYDEVMQSVRTWQQVATTLGLSRESQLLKASCFRV
ncbi:type II toxin-antitoxin system HipA family toxin [Aliidiomarina sp.]|uniref:type II toxin-antitoxin system HipA family toxin n=1 Tax=Aliidiomarina sp. TaxID=1872439 RepID=UPI003A4D958D